MGCLTASAYLEGSRELTILYIPAEGLSATLADGLRGSCYVIHELTGRSTIRRDIRCRAAFICTTNLGDDWPLWASDQVVLTIDGGKVYVTKTT